MDDNRIWNQDAPQNNNTENSGEERIAERKPSQYTHYQMHRANSVSQRSSLRNRQKQRGGMMKKIMNTAVLAVIFGLVAGVMFQGVDIVSQKYFGTEEILPSGEQVAVQDTLETETVTDVSSSAGGSVAAVAEAAMPSVVAITSVSIQEIPSFFGMYGYGTQQYSSEGSGSGIIVGENDDELLIATNNHVVEGADTLSVCFIGDDVAETGEETVELAGGDGDINVEDAVSATVKGTDVANDLAVVAVKKADIPSDTLSQIKIASLGSSEDLQVGEQVVAIGNALGYGQSVTSGWVSALNRSITTEDGASSGLIQTDAAINPGNSGGALLNMQGELIGINSAKYADSAVEGMGYAIPISTAQPILEDLMNRQTREKVDASQVGYLGVEILNLSAQAMQMYNVPAGALVTYVEEGQAASDAGIQAKDIIVEFDGQTVSSKDDLEDKLQYYATGETVSMVIARAENGEYVERSVEITMGARR